MSLKAQIAVKLVEQLQTITELKYVSFDRIRLSSHDFKDFELPAVQLYDVASPGVHQHRCLEVSWQVSLELIMRSNELGAVTQSIMWDMMEQIETVIWAKPKLDLSFTLGSQYIGWVTDLHMNDQQLYFARLDFAIPFHQMLVT